MGKMVRLAVVMLALVFGLSTSALAADEFYVVKDAAGKTMVVEKKPADAKLVVKGPFKTKADAEKALKAASTPRPKLPVAGC